MSPKHHMYKGTSHAVALNTIQFKSAAHYNPYIFIIIKLCIVLSYSKSYCTHVGWLDNAGSFDKLIPLLSPGLSTCYEFVLLYVRMYEFSICIIVIICSMRSGICTIKCYSPY